MDFRPQHCCGLHLCLLVFILPADSPTLQYGGSSAKHLGLYTIRKATFARAVGDSNGRLLNSANLQLELLSLGCVTASHLRRRFFIIAPFVIASGEAAWQSPGNY